MKISKLTKMAENSPKGVEKQWEKGKLLYMGKMAENSPKWVEKHCGKRGNCSIW